MITASPAPVGRRPVRRTLTTAGIALLALVAAACGSSDGGSASDTTADGAGSSTTTAAVVEPYTLKLGFISPQGTLYTMHGYSMENGEFDEIMAEAGVEDIEVVGFPNGTNVTDAFTSGDIDVAIQTDTPAIIGRSNGVETRLLDTVTLGQDAWILGKKDGPTSVEDLAGGTVGVPKGSYADRYLRGVLAEAGILDEVTISNVLPPDAAAALASGDLDAYAAVAPFNVVLQTQGYPVLDEARKDHPELTGASYTIARQAFLDEHPEFVAAWEEARTQALEEISADFDTFVQFQADALGQSIEIQQKAANPLTAYPEERLPDEAKEQLEATKQFLLDQAIITEDFSIDEWYFAGES